MIPMNPAYCGNVMMLRTGCWTRPDEKSASASSIAGMRSSNRNTRPMAASSRKGTAGAEVGIVLTETLDLFLQQTWNIACTVYDPHDLYRLPRRVVDDQIRVRGPKEHWLVSKIGPAVTDAWILGDSPACLKNPKTNALRGIQIITPNIAPGFVDVLRCLRRKCEALHARLRLRSSRSRPLKKSSPSTPSPRESEVQPSLIFFRSSRTCNSRIRSRSSKRRSASRTTSLAEL